MGGMVYQLLVEEKKMTLWWWAFSVAWRYKLDHLHDLLQKNRYASIHVGSLKPAVATDILIDKDTYNI